jgi:hypothetical protein
MLQKRNNHQEYETNDDDINDREEDDTFCESWLSNCYVDNFSDDSATVRCVACVDRHHDYLTFLLDNL